MTDYEWLADRAAESDVRYCNRCGQVGFHEIMQVCDVCDYRPALRAASAVTEQ
jgi:ribosomal protein L37E